MEHAKHLDIAEKMAHVLDNQFGFGPWRFGLDPIIGLLPVVGDIIPFLVSMYIFWIGHTMEVPPRLKHKLVVNAVVDVVIGAIPVVGDVSDFVWKANSRNIALLRRYLAERPLEGTVIAQHTPYLATN